VRVFKLITKNTLRHLLRTLLTILGLSIAVIAFIIIRTTVGAWYAGAEASSPNRLVTRHAVSLTFDLPLAYKEKISKVDGVTDVTHSSWFAGVYVEPANFFAQFAVDHINYFDLYPEAIIPPEQLKTFFTERNSVIVGQGLADRFGWSIGDKVQLTGTIYPGDWDFNIVGIYTGAKETTDENMWFHRWDYLDERMREEMPGRAGRVGSFIIEIEDPSQAAVISERIDALFENSQAETLTETEEAFNLSFVSMGSSIVTGLNIISFMVIGIILLVLGNTMAMTARERVSEYAVLKTLGFRPGHLIGLIFGESMVIAILGGLLGILLTFPAASIVKIALSAFFPIFKISTLSIILASSMTIFVGFLAAIFPTIKAVRTPIVDGLRIID
jgi:putative ABC transport system permease protein